MKDTKLRRIMTEERLSIAGFRYYVIGGGTPYIRYIGMCRPKGYGF